MTLPLTPNLQEQVGSLVPAAPQEGWAGLRPRAPHSGEGMGNKTQAEADSGCGRPRTRTLLGLRIHLGEKSPLAPGRLESLAGI